MTWDDTNAGDGELTATEWNNHVDDQKNHSGRHESGGADEISVAGLSGVLADPQIPVAEDVRDTVAAFLAAGTNVSLTHDDANDTLTIDASDTGTDTDTRVDLTDGSTSVTDPTEATFSATGAASVSVADDGDGTATVEVGATDTDTAWSQTTVTSDVTASDNDSVWADASSAAVTVTLPAPEQGAHVRVVAVNATNDVTVSGNGSENINGSTSDLSLVEGESSTLESDGTNWWEV